jgi:predicted alpha/beta-fold hydrolase
VDHYYRDASTKDRVMSCAIHQMIVRLTRANTETAQVARVGVPLLCINALDDPICSSKSVPFHLAQVNDNLMFLLTQSGGHVAHAQGSAAQR